MRKLLIVAYCFPPIQSGGVYRPLKFVKYLREFGWEPIVLTIDAVCGYPKDNGLLEDIPDGVTVVRTPQVDFPRLVHLIKRITSIDLASTAENIGQGARDNRIGRSKIKKWLTKVKRRIPVILNNVFFVPDNEIPWLPFGVVSTIKLLRREHVDVLMTTSPPHSAHLVGLIVKRLTGIPWVVDFRDLWVDEFDFCERPFGKWRKPIEKIMERLVVKHADRVVTVSRGELLCLRSEYEHLPARKFSTIHNGFDPEDFQANSGGCRENNKKEDKLIITYIGTLYPSTADEFFEVLSNLFEGDPTLGDRIELRFVGYFDPSYEVMGRSANYRKHLKILGYKTHNEAIREMCGSDILLVLLGGHKMKDTEVPGKIFEYMGAGKPILALVRPGDVSSILEGTNLDFTVDPENREGIKQILLKLIELRQRDKLKLNPNSEYINQFSRRELTKKLSTLLDGVSESRK